MNFRRIYNAIVSKPAAVSLIAVVALWFGATAGSLTPPTGVISGTMHTLNEIWDSIASGTYDSSAVVANQNGSLLANLRYIEENLYTLTSDSLDFDEFVDAMTLDADMTIASGGYVLTMPEFVEFGDAVASSAFGKLTVGLDSTTNDRQIAIMGSNNGGIDFFRQRGSYPCCGIFLADIYSYANTTAQGFNYEHPAANIGVFMDASWPGLGTVPAAIRFQTAPASSSALIERMRITSGGNVGIGVSIAAVTGANAVDALFEIRATTSYTTSNVASISGMSLTTGNALAIRVPTTSTFSGLIFRAVDTNSRTLASISAGGSIELAGYASISDAVLASESWLYGYGSTPSVNLRLGALTNVPSIPLYEFTTFDNTATSASLEIHSNRWATDVRFGRDGSTGDRIAARLFHTADCCGVATSTFDLYNSSTSTNTVKMRLNAQGDSYFNGGNIGIGTTSPGSKLEITQGDILINPAFPGQNALKFSTQTFSTTTFGGFTATIPRYGISYLASSSEGSYAAYMSAYGGFKFYTGNTNTVADRLAMVITNAGTSPNTGNVGINDATPEQKLTVGGNILASASGNVDLILNSTTSDDTKFTLRSTGASDRFEILGSVSQNYFTISKSGNVGINKSTPTTTFDVSGRASVSGNLEVGTDRFILDINNSALRMLSADVWFKDVASELFDYRFSRDSGKFVLQASSSGGFWLQNSINFLVENGNVGIGELTPTARLEIRDGTASISDTLWVSPLAYTGNVGIGTATPESKLEVRGTYPQLTLFDGSFTPAQLGGTSCAGGEACFALTSGVGTIPVQLAFSASTSSIVLRANSHVGFGTDDPSAFVHISSRGFDGQALLRLQDSNSTCDFTANAGSPTCGSDARLKKDIEPVTGDSLPKLLALDVVTYRWKTDTPTSPLQTGFIAQNVQSQFPDLVTTSEWVDGRPALFLSMNGLIPHLVKGIQELESRSVDIQALIGEHPISFEADGPLARLVHNVIEYMADVLGIELSPNRIRVQELCLDDVCVTKDELRALLEQGGVEVPIESVDADPEESPIPTPNPTSESIPDETPELTPEPTPEETPEPTPEPTPDSEPAPEPEPTP